MVRSNSSPRAAFSATESAVVLPLLFFLILAIVVGGYGVFRYQQIAMLAREGARYASVHGAQSEQDTGNTAATQNDVYTNAVAPYATNLDLSQLTCKVSWSNGNAPTNLISSGDYEKPDGSTVSVTITYNWFPELFLVGPIVLSSKSTMPMSY